MKAILIVDAQYDFFPGGALGVADGEAIVSQINNWMLANPEAMVIASQDWHPIDTRHFISGGGIWPPHCVQDSHGAQIHTGLNLPENTIFVKKGQNPEDDAGYSAFEGVDQYGRTALGILYDSGITELYVCGLATDYCVKATAMSAALQSGFKTYLLTDAIRAVNINPDDGEKALKEMSDAGIIFQTTETEKK